MLIADADLRALPASEKLRIVEMLWDDLGGQSEPLPLPDWVDREAVRRREEFRRDPTIGIAHEEIWRRIDDCRER